MRLESLLIYPKKNSYWSIGPLVEFQMSNVNKVKLLSERTSGVPLVIFCFYLKALTKFYISSVLQFSFGAVPKDLRKQCLIKLQIQSNAIEFYRVRHEKTQQKSNFLFRIKSCIGPSYHVAIFDAWQRSS